MAAICSDQVSFLLRGGHGRGTHYIFQAEGLGVGNDLVANASDVAGTRVCAHAAETDGLEQRQEFSGSAAVVTREFNLAETGVVHLAQRAFEILGGLGLHRPELDSRHYFLLVMRG